MGGEFKLHLCFQFEGISSISIIFPKDNANRGNTLKLEAKVEFLEGFFQICVCGNGGFECFTRCTFTEKRAKAFYAETCSSVLFVVGNVQHVR